VPSNPYFLLGQALDGLLEAQVIKPGARANAEVSAFSALHGLTCLATSSVYKHLTPGQKWQLLELVKNNILGGLLGLDQVLALKPAMEAALQPGLLGSPLPRLGA
jgi:hypothetical protein